ncbi:hypothetical protein DVA81_18385, partial [Acinetobacter baumannii]
ERSPLTESREAIINKTASRELEGLSQHYWILLTDSRVTTRRELQPARKFRCWQEEIDSLRLNGVGYCPETGRGRGNV